MIIKKSALYSVILSISALNGCDLSKSDTKLQNSELRSTCTVADNEEMLEQLLAI